MYPNFAFVQGPVDFRSYSANQNAVDKNGICFTLVDSNDDKCPRKY